MNNQKDPSIEHDIMMLERLEEYELSDETKKFIRHILSLPEDKREKMLFNYIQGRTGSVILHYENKYVRKIIDKKFS